MQIAKKVQQGFTLIELMIVVAIIGILASIAIPQYEAFIQRSEFKVMETASAPLKVGVEMCIQQHATAGSAVNVLANCDGGFQGQLGDIAANATGVTGDVDSTGVVNGIITITSDSGAFGQTGAQTTYILTPSFALDARNNVTGSVNWAKTGTCNSLRLCR